MIEALGMSWAVAWAIVATASALMGWSAARGWKRAAVQWRTLADTWATMARVLHEQVREDQLKRQEVAAWADQQEGRN